MKTCITGLLCPPGPVWCNLYAFLIWKLSIILDVCQSKPRYLITTHVYKMYAVLFTGSLLSPGAGSSALTSNMVESLSTEFELLSNVVRFLEGKGTPALQLVQGSWNMVQNVLQSPGWIASEQVVASAFLYFQVSSILRLQEIKKS